MLKQIEPGVRAGAPEKIKGLEMMQTAVVWISIGRIANLLGVASFVVGYLMISPNHYLIINTLIACFPVICSAAQVRR